MSSLKKTADRMRSVRSTRQVTASMKVVAVSRLKKKHRLFLKTEPYTQEIQRMIRRLIRHATLRQENLMWQGDEAVLPLPALLKGNGADNRYLLVVITSDEGLSGGAMMQVVQKTEEVISYLEGQGKKVLLFCFGRRGAELLKRRYPHMPLTCVEAKAFRTDTSYLDAERLALNLISAFNHNHFDVCLVIYNHFKSIVLQRPTIEQLIPNKLFTDDNPWRFLIETEEADYRRRDALGSPKITLKKSGFLKALGGADVLSSYGQIDTALLHTGKRRPDVYDYAPSDIALLEAVLPQYVVAYAYRVLLEAEVSDNAARLMAMDNATRNAGDMLTALEKTYRRTRQTKITTDIIEVSFGALTKGETA